MNITKLTENLLQAEKLPLPKGQRWSIKKVRDKPYSLFKQPNGWYGIAYRTEKEMDSVKMHPDALSLHNLMNLSYSFKGFTLHILMRVKTT